MLKISLFFLVIGTVFSASLVPLDLQSEESSQVSQILHAIPTTLHKMWCALGGRILSSKCNEDSEDNSRYTVAHTTEQFKEYHPVYVPEHTPEEYSLQQNTENIPGHQLEVFAVHGSGNNEEHVSEDNKNENTVHSVLDSPEQRNPEDESSVKSDETRSENDVKVVPVENQEDGNESQNGYKVLTKDGPQAVPDNAEGYKLEE